MTATKEKRELKTTRQTWADLLDAMGVPIPPQEDLITRSELLARLRPPGPDMPSMSAASLLDWEKREYLPHAVVRKHGDLVMAVYPPWWPDLVSTVWWLTRTGYSREHAGRAARSWINSTGRKRAFTPLEGYLDAARLAVNGLAHGCRQHQITRADHIAKARLTFVDAAGEEIFATEFALGDSD